MNIGLVLSGGMAKGAYQIGVLRALNDFIPPQEIKYISCASVGVLNGYAYACQKLDYAEKLWKSICNNNARFVVNQIVKSNLIGQSIESLYDPDKTPRSPFYCALFDLSGRNIVYKDLSAADKKLIPLYLKASVAMPFYSRSVYIEGIPYLDGAMIDNIPVYPLLKHNLDYIICVYFDDVSYKFENSYLDNKVIRITFPSESVLKQSVIFRQDNIDYMIKSGYERATYIFKSVFYEGLDKPDRVYRAIEQINQGCKNRSLRITGDMLMTNVNKLTGRLAKRKIL